jgi:formylglycine-generating enzyme required for sulfatase activity
VAAATRIPAGCRSVAEFRRGVCGDLRRLRSKRSSWCHPRPAHGSLVEGRARRYRLPDAQRTCHARSCTRSRGPGPAQRRWPSECIDPDQRRPGRGDGAGGWQERRGSSRLPASRPRNDQEPLAARLRDPHRQLSRIAKPSPLQDLEARGYDLRALPVFRFESVVEEPAKRYGVEVDTVLVDALMHDAPKEDALPLLAFALQRLWLQYAASGKLTKDNYDKVGGLKGLIEDAAERALRGLEPEQDVPLPSAPPPNRRVELGASTFVPALVQISDQGATIRRVAAWTSFSDEQQELLSGFDRWRLVVRKGEADGGTVEVAHEALLREWTRLQGWLEPERARLEVLRSLQVDAATWDRNGKDGAFLNHRDRRLGEATAVVGIERYSQRLGQLEFDYVAGCQVAQRLALRRAGRVQALAGTLATLLALGGVGWWNQDFLREQYFWRRTMGPSVLTGEQEKEKAAKPGSDFKECANGCPTMVIVRAGKFMMGSPESEKDRSDDEGPQHEVTIAKPFAVSKFEVTFAEWDICVAAGACLKASDTGWGRDDRPVMNISWDDAKQYVAWLSRITGKDYRLLSEAEWEYAARAGTTTTYSWGEEIGKGNANCNGCDSQWDNKQTAPVGSFKPNAFGLYDMHGNVYEWVEDPWHHSYEDAPVDGSPWLQGGDASTRVVRGGSWSSYPQGLRAAFRYWVSSGDRGLDIGFRVARTLNP